MAGNGFYQPLLYMYLEPDCPLFLKVNPPKEGPNPIQNETSVGFLVCRYYFDDFGVKDIFLLVLQQNIILINRKAL